MHKVAPRRNKTEKTLGWSQVDSHKERYQWFGAPGGTAESTRFGPIKTYELSSLLLSFHLP